MFNAIHSQFEAVITAFQLKKFNILKKLYYILDNSHTYQCTTVEKCRHGSYNMAVKHLTVLVGQPLYSTVQHDLCIKNQHSAVAAWKMNVYPAEFWLPL